MVLVRSILALGIVWIQAATLSARELSMIRPCTSSIICSRMVSPIHFQQRSQLALSRTLDERIRLLGRG